MNTRRTVRLSLPLVFAFAGLFAGCGGGDDAKSAPSATPPAATAPGKKEFPKSTILQQRLRIEELRARINALPTGTDDQMIEVEKISRKFSVIEIKFSKTNIKAMGFSTEGIQGTAHYELNQIEKQLDELEKKK